MVESKGLAWKLGSALLPRAQWCQKTAREFPLAVSLIVLVHEIQRSFGAWGGVRQGSRKPAERLADILVAKCHGYPFVDGRSGCLVVVGQLPGNRSCHRQRGTRSIWRPGYRQVVPRACDCPGGGRAKRRRIA